MPSSIFCCTAIQPYRPKMLSHESKFTSFMAWAKFPRESQAEKDIGMGSISDRPHAVQLVQQVNFGPLESTRYFVPSAETAAFFTEVEEMHLLQANFQKVNTYKNYKCNLHNKFFEINIYQKDPINQHHWRMNLARPSREIDLPPPATHQAGMGHHPITPAQAPVADNANGAAHFSDGDSQRCSLSPSQLWEDHDYGDIRAGGSGDDFTACDKECGYCGRCSY